MLGTAACRAGSLIDRPISGHNTPEDMTEPLHALSLSDAAPLVVLSCSGSTDIETLRLLWAGCELQKTLTPRP